MRGRVAGDRMAQGPRIKLQDVMTDAKVPARLREVQPCIVTRSGDVWWVPGVTSAEDDGEWRILARRTG
ncbi:hypothetical protein BH18CHL2_BH18CHL2_11140 [soil metagenome]